jgi:FCD domain-containing protein
LPLVRRPPGALAAILARQKRQGPNASAGLSASLPSRVNARSVAVAAAAARRAPALARGDADAAAADRRDGDRTLAEHRASYDAIENGRPELARAWMAVHLASVEAWLELASRETVEAAGVGAQDGVALRAAQ